MKALLARLFPMIVFVSAKTARSNGFRAWIALCASCFVSLNPLERAQKLTLPLKASNGFMLSSYLSLYRPISSSRRITPFNIPAPLDPLEPGMAVSRYDWVYLTFSYSFRLSDCRDLISARRSEIDSNCFRSSCIVSITGLELGLRRLTSSSSALRCLNRSRCEVTIGRIDVSPFAPTAGEARPS
jgi:hypothetical protein